MKRFFGWLGLNKDWHDEAAEAAAKAEEMIQKSKQRIEEDKKTFRFFRHERTENHLAERFYTAIKGH